MYIRPRILSLSRGALSATPNDIQCNRVLSSRHVEMTILEKFKQAQLYKTYQDTDSYLTKKAAEISQMPSCAYVMEKLEGAR